MKLCFLFVNRRVSVGLFAVLSVAGMVQTAPAADEKPTIPIIVKDTTSNYWQMVLAGARKAGKDLNVNVPELGAQSPSDINGQISILENAVSEKPAAIVIAPSQKAALGKPIDEAARAVKIGRTADVTNRARPIGFSPFPHGRRPRDVKPTINSSIPARG